MMNRVNDHLRWCTLHSSTWDLQMWPLKKLSFDLLIGRSSIWQVTASLGLILCRHQGVQEVLKGRKEKAWAGEFQVSWEGDFRLDFAIKWKQCWWLAAGGGGRSVWKGPGRSGGRRAAVGRCSERQTSDVNLEKREWQPWEFVLF